MARLLASAPMRRIGLLSYSLYLWHWPVFVLMRWTVGLQTPVQMTAAMALVLLLSWVSWRWVEQPFRGPLSQRLRPGRWVLSGAVVLLCCRHPVIALPAGAAAVAEYRQPASGRLVPQWQERGG